MRTISRSFVVFSLRCVGLVVKPYETYREIVEHPRVVDLGWIGLSLSVYFVIASIVRTSLFRPFLLTKQWVLLLGATGITFGIAVGLFWFIGRFFGGKGNLKGVILGWGYSLMPTLVWFWMTSLLYVVLPPPRTQSGAGILFSVLYLVISVTLLFWKITLAYLTLRFGLRLDLGKILLTSVVVVPMLGVYSILMYRLGIFRIPFI